MKDIMEFRNSIEIKMTELAAKRATDEQIQIISGHLEKMKNEEYKLTHLLNSTIISINQ